MKRKGKVISFVVSEEEYKKIRVICSRGYIKPSHLIYEMVKDFLDTRKERILDIIVQYNQQHYGVLLPGERDISEIKELLGIEEGQQIKEEKPAIVVEEKPEIKEEERPVFTTKEERPVFTSRQQEEQKPVSEPKIGKKFKYEGFF